jgi:transcriptional regulator with GAF, ATPase, and Fis domain
MAEQDLLHRTTDEIRARLKELEPLVQEHERLRAALTALEESTGQKSLPRRGRAGRGSGRGATTSRRAGRGERRQQLLEVLNAEPGVRPSEAAKRMGINPSQLHALVRRLEEAGELERRDGALYASADAASAA